MSFEIKAQKTYSEQSLECVVENLLSEVIVLHHSANPMSRTHPGEEEAVVFASAEPQRGFLLLLSYFMHFGKEEAAAACKFF